IGTLLPPHILRPDGSRYESGTVWEYDDARLAKKEVWVYRRTEKPRIEIDDPKHEKKREQYQAVNQFFEQFKDPDGSLKRGFNRYGTTTEFRDKFEKHLQILVRDRLEAEEATKLAGPERLTAGPSPPVTWTWPKPWDFSGYINEKRHAFIGRE